MCLLVWLAVLVTFTKAHNNVDLCSRSLTDNYNDPFIFTELQHQILKGYCPGRLGWAALQQIQTTGYGPYGNVFVKSFTAGNESKLYLQEVYRTEILQNFKSDHCLLPWEINLNISITSATKSYHTFDYKSPSEFYSFTTDQNQNYMFEMAPSFMRANYKLIIQQNYKEVIHSTFSHTLNGGQYITSMISPSSISSESTKTQYAVMSYNIQNFHGSWKLRMNMIRSTIRQSDPDVIGFQEVRLDESKEDPHKHQVDILKELLSELGYAHYAFQPAMSYLGLEHFYFESAKAHEEGVAIFSKHPIIHTEYILLSRNMSDSSSHQRICLYGDILLPNNIHLGFYVTHLSLLDHSRRVNIQEILSYTKQHVSDIKLLVGDYNSEPEEPTISTLFQNGWFDLHKQYCDIELRDSSACVCEGSECGPSNTFSTEGNYNKRIDYIYSDRRVKVGSFNVTGGNSVTDSDGQQIFPSDHFCIDVSFSIL
ncbi:hypothetical protein AKO1_003160 [Acrasis kona]|uniref:Endonuclease/exonuclease/phosphatase domain-containing protein n=1 Tax=Acrasis kona TaxID=1008807 RepID=A0AAW2ZA63_9EUKA